MKERSIVSIGAGNVATHLISYLHKKLGYEITQIYSRKIKNAKKLAKKVKAEPTDNFAKIDGTGRVVLISLPDDIIATLKIDTDKDTVLLHTSGATSSEVLSNMGNNYGVLYPLQTFQKDTKLNLKNVPIFTTGNNTETKLVLQTLANGISDNVVSITDQERTDLHLAAVISNNFIHHLASLSEQFLIEKGLQLDYLLPILKETFNKINAGNLIESQTGPARRNDKSTIKKHKKSLRKHKELLTLYKAITKSIKNQYK
jgi:predicted short-subunit dehydrogenase-like oxidoreductase (DUF2520 family)